MPAVSKPLDQVWIYARESTESDHVLRGLLRIAHVADQDTGEQRAYLSQGNGLTQSVKTEPQTVHNVQKADSGAFQLLDGIGVEFPELGVFMSLKSMFGDRRTPTRWVGKTPMTACRSIAFDPIDAVGLAG